MHGKTIKRFTPQVPWQGSRLLPPRPKGAGGTVVCGQTAVARKKIQNKVEIWSLFPYFPGSWTNSVQAEGIQPRHSLASLLGAGVRSDFLVISAPVTAAAGQSVLASFGITVLPLAFGFGVQLEAKPEPKPAESRWVEGVRGEQAGALGTGLSQQPHVWLVTAPRCWSPLSKAPGNPHRQRLARCLGDPESAAQAPAAPLPTPPPSFLI